MSTSKSNHKTFPEPKPAAGRQLPRSATLVACGILIASALQAERYAYVRVLEGEVESSAVSGSSGSSDSSAVGAAPLTQHSSVFAGDRLATGEDGYLELVLPDGNRLRVDSRSAVVLLEGDDPGTPTTAGRTVASLEQGRVQFVVSADPQQGGATTMVAGSYEIYLRTRGRYVIAVGAQGLDVTVREGEVEVLGHRGSTVVVAGESAHWAADSMAVARISRAEPPDFFEERGLVEETTRLAAVLPEPDLVAPYEAADLATHGNWLKVDGDWAWAPVQTASWSPYSNGYWQPTPSGLSWVSNAPWGWYPYHYGSWDLRLGVGWIWRPGPVFSTAWVRWYVTPSTLAWIPSGYYHHHLHRGWHSGHRDWHHWHYQDRNPSHYGYSKGGHHGSPSRYSQGHSTGGRLLDQGDSPYYQETRPAVTHRRSGIGSPPTSVARVSSRSMVSRSPAVGAWQGSSGQAPRVDGKQSASGREPVSSRLPSGVSGRDSTSPFNRTVQPRVIEPYSASRDGRLPGGSSSRGDQGLGVPRASSSAGGISSRSLSGGAVPGSSVTGRSESPGPLSVYGLPGNRGSAVTDRAAGSTATPLRGTQVRPSLPASAYRPATPSLPNATDRWTGGSIQGPGRTVVGNPGSSGAVPGSGSSSVGGTRGGVRPDYRSAIPTQVAPRPPTRTMPGSPTTVRPPSVQPVAAPPVAVQRGDSGRAAGRTVTASPQGSGSGSATSAGSSGAGRSGRPRP